MKREWDIDELIEHFSLSGQDFSLLDGKESHNQLGIAALLKYFQYEGRFPSYKREIPRAVLAFIAEQLAMDAQAFEAYAWESRTISRDRGLIREYLGFREATEDDRTVLTAWLVQHPDMQREHSENYWLSVAYGHLRELQIEPFTSDKMERMVRSALNTYQENVCEVIHARLSASMVADLGALLEPEVATAVECENPWSRLANLKDDPNGVDLKNVLEAGEKLRQLRQIGLPLNLFVRIGYELALSWI